jgi:HpcH/HpaI aldolase/citrate lyase family
MAPPFRPRRTCLAVPGSSLRFLDKARGLPVDEVFLDLEDAVAPGAKPGARGAVIQALNGGGWEGKIRAVRINDATTGAVMLGDEMIDEASRKLALVTAAKGRAAGLARTRAFDPGPPQPQPSTPQAVSVSARPLVRGRSVRPAGLTQRAPAASSPAASVPPVTVAA